MSFKLCEYFTPNIKFLKKFYFWRSSFIFLLLSRYFYDKFMLPTRQCMCKKYGGKISWKRMSEKYSEIISSYLCGQTYQAKWIQLSLTTFRHNQTRRTTSSLRKSTLLIQGDSPPTIEDFDKKLSETDCYLQILLNQVAALKFKIGQYFHHIWLCLLLLEKMKVLLIFIWISKQDILSTPMSVLIIFI